jgi:hypothetical protein
MSDDGGPVGPDPARWSDPEWRDNLGELDTFADEVRMGLPAIGTITVRRSPGPLVPRRSSHGHRAVADPGRTADSRVADGVSVRDKRTALPGFSAAVGLRTAVVLSRAIEARNQAEDSQADEAIHLEFTRFGRTAGAFGWESGRILFD